MRIERIVTGAAVEQICLATDFGAVDEDDNAMYGDEALATIAGDADSQLLIRWAAATMLLRRIESEMGL